MFVVCVMNLEAGIVSSSAESFQFDKSAMIQQKIKKAQACINSGQFATAETLLRGVLKLAPGNRHAKALLVSCEEGVKKQKMKELQAFNDACSQATPFALQSFISKYPKSEKVNDAKNRLQDYKLWHVASSKNTLDAYNDYLFGISGNGKLLTHNGGNIYTNFGSLMVDVPGCPYYAGEVDISRFTQVKDILPFRGLILLNKDGTVRAIGETEWSLGAWSQIEQVCGYDDSDAQSAMLYGLRRDGTVIANEFRYSDGRQNVNNQYRGWKLRDMYEGWGGVIGLTTDGKLVGDGAYRNVDFSIFN